MVTPVTSAPTHPTGSTRRVVVAGMSTLTAVVLLFGYHTSTEGPATSETVAAAPPVAGSTDGTGGSSDGTGGSSDGADAGTASSTSVTGSVAQTRWGPVQVQVTTASGQITAVDVVEYPDQNPRDQEINAYAIPTLVQETLDAQGADVDVVSGATVTSEGYLQSLQSALDQAGL